LRTVNLDANAIVEKFPAVLAATTALSAANPQLIRLQLAVRCNHIGDAGARALAAIPRITHLSIDHNGIGPAGAKALAANTVLSRYGIQVILDRSALIKNR
jgi:hypothetical protein